MTARWALLAGGRGVDGSALASRLAGELGARGLRVGGVVQDPIELEGGGRGYVAREVGGSERALLAREGAPPPGAAAAVCSFVFDTAAFSRAREWIRRGSREAAVVVIDEVSKLEVARGGHHDAVREALGGDALVLLVVRGDQLFSVMERFELGEPIAALESGDAAAFARFVDDVARAASARRT